MGGSRRKGSGSRRRKTGSSGRMSDDELRRYVKILIVPFVLIVLIVVVFVSNSITELREKKAGSESAPVESASGNTSIEDTPIEPDTKEYTHDFGESPLKKDEIPEITQLMEAYFQAEAECDVDKFNSLFTSGDTSQSEALKAAFEKQREYIEGYGNISCYTINGPYDNYYIAYTYYETKYLLAETPGPGLIHPYVVQGEDGTWKIYDGEMTDELNRYLEEVEALEDVRLLATEVDNDLEQAMAEDDDLRKIIEFVRGGSHREEESLSDEGGSDGTSREETDTSETDSGGQTTME